MPIRSELVADALLCATNDGRMYPRFIKTALLEHKEGEPSPNSIGGHASIAAQWLSYVGAFLPTYNRTTDQRLSAPERLQLAAELSLHYAQDLDEWSPEDRIAKCKELFIP